MSEWANNVYNGQLMNAGVMDKLHEAFSEGRVYSLHDINGGRYYTGGPEDGNIFIGTQDNTYNLGSSRYLAGLIAHEGTHSYQDYLGLNPNSRYSEYAAHAAQQAVLNGEGHHTLSAEELSAINNAYEYSTLNNASVADINGYQFGDGSLEANPDTTNGIIEAYRNIYGELPSDEILETLVGLAAQEMMFGGSENLEAVCRLVVEQYGAGISGDEAEFWETEDGENTEQGNQYAAWNPLSFIIKPARQLEQQEMAEAQQQVQAATQKAIYEGTMAWVKSFDNSNLNFKKYEKKIKEATAGVTDQNEINKRKLLVTTAETLKERISKVFKSGILTAEQKRQIMVEVDAALVRVLGGTIKYGNSTASPGYTTSGVINVSEIVCTQFMGLDLYIAGTSSSQIGKTWNWPGNNSGFNCWLYNPGVYIYEEGFDPLSRDANGNFYWPEGSEDGVVVMANNLSLYTPTNINLDDMKKWFRNPEKYKEQIAALNGMTYFCKWSGDISTYTYSHTAKIGINLDTDGNPASITIYESNPSNDATDGVRMQTYSFSGFIKESRPAGPLAAMKKIKVCSPNY